MESFQNLIDKAVSKFISNEDNTGLEVKNHIIYGENGNGKTSFIKKFKEKTNEEILVFNRTYVNNNIGQYTSDNGLTGFIFGATNNNKKEQIDNLDKQIRDTTKKIDSTQQDIEDNKNRLEEIKKPIIKLIDEKKDNLAEFSINRNSSKSITLEKLSFVEEYKDLYQDEQEYQQLLTEFENTKEFEGQDDKIIAQIAFKKLSLTVESIEKINVELNKCILLPEKTEILKRYLDDKLQYHTLRVQTLKELAPTQKIRSLSECPVCYSKDIEQLKNILEDFNNEQNNSWKNEVTESELYLEKQFNQIVLENILDKLKPLISEDSLININTYYIAIEIEYTQLKEKIDSIINKIKERLKYFSEIQTSNIKNIEPIDTNIITSIMENQDKIQENINLINQCIRSFNQNISFRKIIRDGLIHYTQYILGKSEKYKNYIQEKQNIENDIEKLIGNIEQYHLEIENKKESKTRLLEQPNPATCKFNNFLKDFFQKTKFSVSFEKKDNKPPFFI